MTEYTRDIENGIQLEINDVNGAFYIHYPNGDYHSYQLEETASILAFLQQYQHVIQDLLQAEGIDEEEEGE